MGLEVLPKVVVSRTLTGMAPEQVREEVCEHIQEVIDGLTKPLKVPAAVTDGRPSERISFDGRDLLEVLKRVNRTFIETGWGDGFPIIPPTSEAVEEMLSGTRRSRDEVVLIMEPGRGVATVEKIAINCVMAGCQPGHLPVVIAAVQAMAEPEFNLSYVSQSTTAHAPLFVVNGPIVKDLEINFGRCALGPGAPSAANTAIGRAVRLVMMNVGHAYPGVLDMDTIGSPIKYSMCMAENEEANPWEPLHVERGYGKDSNIITAFPCANFMDVANLVSYTPEKLLTTFAYHANAPQAASWGWMAPEKAGFNKENLLVLAPDHARLIADAGWTKNDVRRFMFHNAKIPLGVIRTMWRPSVVAPGWSWLVDAPDETLVPVVRDPQDFNIVVVGGDAGKSAYMFGIGAPVSKEIKI